MAELILRMEKKKRQMKTSPHPRGGKKILDERENTQSYSELAIKLLAKEEDRRGSLGQVAALGQRGVSFLGGGVGCTLLGPPFSGMISFPPGPTGRLEKSLSAEPLSPHPVPEIQAPSSRQRLDWRPC